MKKYFIVLSIFFSSVSYSQFDLNAGMGLNFFSAPDLRDYVNSNFSSTEEMASFNTSADFFIGFAYNLNESYQIGLEYNYNIYSFNSNSILGIYDLQINKHEPSLVGYYQITGNGYKFKLGGGVGYRLGYADEKQPGTTEIIDYSSIGFGLLAKVQGDTKLGGDFYALIAGEIRYDLYSDIETITPNVSFNLNSFGVALKLGVVHYF